MSGPRFKDVALSEAMSDLVRKTGHRTLSIWAADCAERVLPLFEAACPNDRRPREAIDALREFARTGRFSMTMVRSASLAAHAAAREAEDDRARFAARAAGQAVATAHVPAHAPGAALYAAKALWVSDPLNARENIAKERERQYERLVELNRASGSLDDAREGRLFRIKAP